MKYFYANGMRGIVHKWFCDYMYLYNRKQFISVDDIVSELGTINRAWCTVQHGSVLG